MNTIKDIVNQHKTLLPEYTTQEAKQLIFMLIEKVLNVQRTYILTYQDTKVSISDYNQIINFVKRLKKQEPIQYVIGETEFYGLPFIVEAGVLIPRPETEELVQLIIDTNKNTKPIILDIGTGSGCIAIALSKNINKADVTGIDISDKAIALANKNKQVNKAKVSFFKHDILNSNVLNLPQNVDILVSNPPYVNHEQKKQMQANVVDYEPHTALFVPNDNPLIFYNKIADIGKKILTKGGYIFFEINEIFGKQMLQMMIDKGYKNVSIHKDINKKDRILKANL